MERLESDILPDENPDPDHANQKIFKALIDSFSSTQILSATNQSFDRAKGKSFLKILSQRARKSPDETAASIGGESIDFKTLQEAVLVLRNHFFRRSVSREDVIEIYIENSILALVALLGSVSCGAIPYFMKIEELPNRGEPRVSKSTDGPNIILTVSDLRHLIPLAKDQVCIAIDEILI